MLSILLYMIITSYFIAVKSVKIYLIYVVNIIFSLLKFAWISGKGDGFYSSSFQATLQGNDLYDAKLPTCNICS